MTGGFDPIHSGHIDHIRKAKGLGGHLTVITCPDSVLVEKKGYCLVPLADRVAVLEGLKWVDRVVVGEYTEGCAIKTIRELNPDLYAKGGDRTEMNMEQAEIDVCQEIGCMIAYGVGDLLNSSSGMLKRVLSLDECCECTCKEAVR